MPSVYQQSCAPPQQYIQRVSYPQNNISKAANYQQQPISAGCQTAYPIQNGQQTYSTNKSNTVNANQSINGREKAVTASYASCDCMMVKPIDFRSLKRPVEISHRNPNRNPNCKLCQEETNQVITVTEDEEEDLSVEITKFIRGSGSFKREPDSFPDLEVLENEAANCSNGGGDNNDSGMGSPPHMLGDSSSSVSNNNENADPINLHGGETMNEDSSEVPEELNCAMEDEDQFRVLGMSSGEGISEVEIKNNNLLTSLDGDNISSCGANNCGNTGYTSNNSKLSIEAVTNRLALRERSKIFRRSEKKWHVAVNETAFQLVLKEPKLLLRKKDLRLRAESEVRKTYIFAKV